MDIIGGVSIILIIYVTNIIGIIVFSLIVDLIVISIMHITTLIRTIIFIIT